MLLLTECPQLVVGVIAEAVPRLANSSIITEKRRVSGSKSEPTAHDLYFHSFHFSGSGGTSRWGDLMETSSGVSHEKVPQLTTNSLLRVSHSAFLLLATDHRSSLAC